MLKKKSWILRVKSPVKVRLDKSSTAEALSIKPCCVQPKYKRADKLVWKAYDTLVSVSFMSNAMVHLLLTLKEMPTARDAIGTEILQSALQA